MANIAELGPCIGQVETDTFCEGCGYNLHTQMVVRDERLGILVSRCPECGRFAAAGRVTSASSVWLNRLGTILLVVLVVFLLTLFGLCTFFLGLVPYGHTIEATTFDSDTYTPVPTHPMLAHSFSSNAPYAKNRGRLWSYRVPRQIRVEDEQNLDREFQVQMLLASIAGALGLITGGLFTVLLWHCKGFYRAFALLPPLVGCGGAAFIWLVDPMTVFIREWGVVHIALYLLIEIPALAIGAWTGRPIARGMLNLIVPPKARQHLAFLWIVDGKVPLIRSKPDRAGSVGRALPAKLPTGEHSQSGRTRNGT
jgi:hypothetical protein